MVKDNTSEIGSLNKAPHFANIDRAEAHVRCIIGDLELRPAEKRARQARTQEYFSGARAVNREGEGKSFRRKRIQKCTKNKVWPDPIWTVKQLLSELHKFDNVLYQMKINKIRTLLIYTLSLALFGWNFH